MQIIIQLPKTEATFLEKYIKRHKITIDELIDMYIKQLQMIEEHSSFDIDAEIEQHAGIIPSDIDVKKEYYDYLEEKHR